jgi:hypothetical protein
LPEVALPLAAQQLQLQSLQSQTPVSQQQEPSEQQTAQLQTFSLPVEPCPETEYATAKPDKVRNPSKPPSHVFFDIFYFLPPTLP